jgi:hypothetical protein
MDAGSAESQPAITFNVGDMVMIEDADGQLQERQVVEVSSKTVNRKKRPYYKLQSAGVVSRKRGRMTEEWYVGEDVRRHDPQALAASAAAKSSGVRTRRGAGGGKEGGGEEGGEEGKEEGGSSSPGRMTRSGSNGDGGGGGGGGGGGMRWSMIRC